MSSNKLVKHVAIRATLETKSGLHIGGTEAAMNIGGSDSPIIRDFYGKPYIPGSSLKGKLRSMLEYKLGKTATGQPCGCGFPNCMVCRVFGAHRNLKHDLGPSRIIVRDAALSESTIKQIQGFQSEGKEYSETKTETMIDRRTGMAAGGSLRNQERLPAGACFNLEISLRVFDGDNEKEMVDFVKEGLSLLQKDYLGGSGTRGSGWVEIKNLTVSDL